jgi:hypothetical protein
MADSCALDVRQGTTHGQLDTCVIEALSSWRQSLSCDLSQVLPLRGGTRSPHESIVIVVSGDRHKV